MGEELRLSPEMASRKLLTLKFIHEYIARWNGSPSLGEIANATGVSRQRALELVKKLHREGKIVRVAGPRGITLPGDDTVAQLRAEGWIVLRADEPMTDPFTLSGLPADSFLSHTAPGDTGENHEIGGGRKAA